MLRKAFTFLAGLSFSALAAAQGPQPMDDAELGQISGGDGINMAMHLSLNDPSIPGATKNRLMWGFNDGTQKTYLVIDNLRGNIDLYALGFEVQKKPDGEDYVALSLPSHLKFTNFGFDSVSAQTNPTGPVTGNLGGVNINGSLSMQGQLRIWPH